MDDFTTLLYHALIILNNSGDKIAIKPVIAIKIKLFYFTKFANVTALP